MAQPLETFNPKRVDEILFNPQFRAVRCIRRTAVFILSKLTWGEGQQFMAAARLAEQALYHQLKAETGCTNGDIRQAHQADDDRIRKQPQTDDSNLRSDIIITHEIQ